VNLNDLSKSAFLWAAAIAALGHLTAIIADTSYATTVSAGPRTSCEESVEDEIVDLELLEQGIRKTKAVGFLTKLKLAGEIKDLLAKFERYHAGNNDLDIDQLNEQFDLLYMKVVSLVQDKDFDLHRQLCNSWTQIGHTLQNPDYFSKA
jgi:hypothetical protein